jgi:hypothetical protein
MESRVDTKIVELVKNLTAEIEKSQKFSQRSLETSNERILSIMKQLAERLDSKTGELAEEFNRLLKENQDFFNKRSR